MRSMRWSLPILLIAACASPARAAGAARVGRVDDALAAAAN